MKLKWNSIVIYVIKRLTTNLKENILKVLHTSSLRNVHGQNTLSKIYFFEIDSKFYDNITNHRKHFELYLIENDFKGFFTKNSLLILNLKYKIT